MSLSKRLCISVIHLLILLVVMFVSGLLTKTARDLRDNHIPEVTDEFLDLVFGCAVTATVVAVFQFFLTIVVVFLAPNGAFQTRKWRRGQVGFFLFGSAIYAIVVLIPFIETFPVRYVEINPFIYTTGFASTIFLFYSIILGCSKTEETQRFFVFETPNASPAGVVGITDYAVDTDSTGGYSDQTDYRRPE